MANTTACMYMIVCVCRLFGGGRSPLSVDTDSTISSPSARCARCDQQLDAGDLVMRVHLAVFHSSCFNCFVCRRRLSRGQQFALVDTSHIYCRADYERRHGHAGSAVADDTAAPAGGDERRLVFAGHCEELPRDAGVSPAAKTDEDALSPSSCAARTLGSRRTRKLTPSVHQNPLNCMLT